MSPLYLLYSVYIPFYKKVNYEVVTVDTTADAVNSSDDAICVDVFPMACLVSKPISGISNAGGKPIILTDLLLVLLVAGAGYEGDEGREVDTQ